MCCLLISGLVTSGCSTILTATNDEPITMNPGKRSLGAAIDDRQLETIAKVNLNKASPELYQSSISVTSYNGVVLLTGQVDSEQSRQLATATVNKIPKVRQVHNELQVQGNISFLARSNDTWLATKVKSKLLLNEDIDSGRIKVVVEDGVVYMMGLLTQIETNRAAEVIRATSGVQKVVKAIEYIE